MRMNIIRLVSVGRFLCIVARMLVLVAVAQDSSHLGNDVVAISLGKFHRMGMQEDKTVAELQGQGNNLVMNLSHVHVGSPEFLSGIRMQGEPYWVSHIKLYEKLKKPFTIVQVNTLINLSNAFLSNIDYISVEQAIILKELLCNILQNILDVNQNMHKVVIKKINILLNALHSLNFDLSI